MTLSLDILAARMRQGESIPLGDTARVAVALSVPAILQQLVVTAMEYIDAAMVAGCGPVFAGQCFGLLWHLVRSPAVQHGHGDVLRHAAGHG